MKQRGDNIAVVDWLQTVAKENAQRLGKTSGRRLTTTESRHQQQRNGLHASQLFWRNSAHLLPHQHSNGVVM